MELAPGVKTGRQPFDPIDERRGGRRCVARRSRCTRNRL